jgi:hypothetical protein
MPNRDQTGDAGNHSFSRGKHIRRFSRGWTPPVWLEPAFIYSAFFVALVASIALLLWLLVTFVVPFNVYSRETDEISLSNGQLLQIEYPNLVLAGENPAEITLILYGISNAAVPANFNVEIPDGLTVVEPIDQAQGKKLTLIASGLGSDKQPEQLKIKVVNSHYVGGICLLIRQPVIISSRFMPDKQNIKIGIEKTSWATAREIVNNTIDEKSALILLVTGFLSGAGSLVLQYIKAQWDRLQADKQTKEKRFSKLLQEDFEGTISVFLRRAQENRPQNDDFNIYKPLVEQFNWYQKLSAIVRENLKKRDFVEATRVVKNLKELSTILGPTNEETRDLNSLYRLCELASIVDRQKARLSEGDPECLLAAYEQWQELGSIITDLIQDFSFSPKNLFRIYDVLKRDNNGVTMLKNSNLQYVIGGWQIKKLNKIDVKKFESIKKEIAYSLRWRPIWPNPEQILPEKVQRWLSRNWYE